MQIQSSRFGSIDVPEESIVHFPRGLFGLEKVRYYCLLQHDDQGRFQWLHALDDPGIAMLVVNPLVHFPTYEFEIPDSAAELLKQSLALRRQRLRAVRGKPVGEVGRIHRHDPAGHP